MIKGPREKRFCIGDVLAMLNPNVTLQNSKIPAGFVISFVTLKLSCPKRHVEVRDVERSKVHQVDTSTNGNT